MPDSLTQIVASIPPGVNPFSFLREALHAQITPTVSDAIFPVLYTIIGVYAVMTVTTAVGFVLRWRKGQLWFYKRASLPTGNLIVPHPVNVFAVFAMVYMTCAQGDLAGYVVALHRIRQGEILIWLRCYIGQLVFIPLFFAAAGDMAGSLTGVLTSRFRNDQYVPRWLRTSAVHGVVFGLPIVFALGLVCCYTAVGVVGTQLYNVANALDTKLAIDEGTWTTGLPIAQLLPLQPLGLAVQAKTADLILVFRATYGFIAACLILLWLLWAPANYFQIRALLRQIHHLRQTARHEKQTSREEHAIRSQRSARMSISGRGGRDVSSLERQATRLMTQCWTRVGSQVGFTLVVVVYLFIACWIASDPATANSSPSRAFFFVISTFVCYILVGVPVLAIFFLRSFDARALKVHTGQTTAGSRSGMEVHSQPGNEKVVKGQLISFSQAGATVTPPLVVHVDIESATRVDVDDNASLEEPKQFVETEQV